MERRESASTKMSQLEATSRTLRQPPRVRQKLHKEIKRFKPEAVSASGQRTRSRQITICLFCFIAAVCCLNPFASMHLTQRVGLLLFESDLIQLRSSLICLIVCSIVLAVVNTTFILMFKNRKTSKQKSTQLQSIISKLLSLFAVISATSYLSIAFVVPHIKQIQRMPLATFDCDANLITVENCEQQFTTHPSEQSSLVSSVLELLAGDLNGNNERLIEKFNCLKYNSRRQGTLEVPTRFLLHKCGLVCKPHRQQLNQFSDDLNRDQNYPKVTPEDEPIALIDRTSASQNLAPPYDAARPFSSTSGASDPQSSQVSMRICFSGEFTGGPNYKQFCVTNLANRGLSQQEGELTVGQLNKMLRSITTSDNVHQEQPEYAEMNSDSITAREPHVSETQATQYVNPVVQFESQFKNWPTIVNSGEFMSESNHEFDSHKSRSLSDQWCKFKPIPPFIVNNKPFSDIQCSLEHEYTVTTGPASDSARYGGQGADRIYLKKSTPDIGVNENLARERCNIQCKVNILYQVHLKNRNKNSAENRLGRRDNDEVRTSESTNYYLPLKPCVIVSGTGNKTRTSNYYLTFRATGDTSLLLTFILLDLILLLESIDTKQFHFESKRLRLVGLLFVVTLVPLIVALAFDLTTDSSPNDGSMSKFRRDGYLITLINEKIIPNVSDLIVKLVPSLSSARHRAAGSNDRLSDADRTNKTLDPMDSRPTSGPNDLPFRTDNYMLPFLLYSFLMFGLAISSFTLPATPLTTPLARVSSIEELGIDQHDPLEEIEPPESYRDEESKDDAKYTDCSGLSSRKTAIFALAALFMGLQFNLSQFVPLQVFIETFGNPGLPVGQNFAVSWFVVGTQSTASLLTLSMLLVFLDKSSAFFATLTPFKSATADGDERLRSGETQLLKYLAISLAIYSMRYYILAELNPLTRFKWPIVLLVQVAEALNFPLTWFALCLRAQELLMTHPAYRYFRGPKSSLASESRALSVHLVVQSTLALTYFAVARFAALFAHSLHASLYLHSENFDWFIASYYRSLRPSTPKAPVAASTSISRNANESSASQRNSAQTARLSDEYQAQPPSAKADSLFAPLPDERQTYMHSLRLFIKYNSLLCLLISLSLVLVLLYNKYQIWAEQKRQLEQSLQLQRQQQLARQKSSYTSENIEERLSSDLMQIHSSSARRGRPRLSPPALKTIYPRPLAGSSNSLVRSKDDLQSPSADDERSRADSRSPRAKILFRYDLGRADSSDGETKDTRAAERQPQNERLGNMSHTLDEGDLSETDNISLDPPPGLEDAAVDEHQSGSEFEADFSRDEVLAGAGEPEHVTERIVRQRNKRVRIFEDREEWPLEREYAREIAAPRAKRNISFAPTTTMISDSGSRDSIRVASASQSSSGSGQQQQQRVGARQASPEPSIGEEAEDSEESHELDSIERRNHANRGRSLRQTEF